MSPAIPNDSTDADKLTESPACVDIRSQVPTKGDGADFRSIRNRDCLEDTPGYTTQNLGDLQVNDVLCCEEYGDEASNQRQAGYDRITISKPLRYISIDQQTNDLALQKLVCAVSIVGMKIEWDSERGPLIHPFRGKYDKQSLATRIQVT